MQVAGQEVFYEDIITIVENKAGRGIWWARGELVPGLRILVHATAVRASGLRDLDVSERKRTVVGWNEKRATALLLWPTSDDVSPREFLRNIRRMSERDNVSMLTLEEVEELLKKWPDSAMLKFVKKYLPVVKMSRGEEGE